METRSEMPALTDEQRQELIEFAKKEFQCWNDGGPYQQLLQIALAAMTAPAMGRVNRGEVSDSNEYLDARVECLHDQADWENFQDGYLLYPAPPVPALKLPDVSEGDPGKLHDVRTRHDFSNGFRFAIEEVKRLNGVAK